MVESMTQDYDIYKGSWDDAGQCRNGNAHDLEHDCQPCYTCMHYPCTVSYILRRKGNF